jgi:predicted RND superfamily exporter protein
LSQFIPALNLQETNKYLVKFLAFIPMIAALVALLADCPFWPGYHHVETKIAILRMSEHSSVSEQVFKK